LIAGSVNIALNNLWKINQQQDIRWVLNLPLGSYKIIQLKSFGILIINLSNAIRYYTDQQDTYNI